MAESSAKRAAEGLKFGHKSVSSSTTASKGGAAPQHRVGRPESSRKKPIRQASLKTSSTSNLNVGSLPTEKDSDNSRDEDEFASTAPASGKKPKASSYSAAKRRPSTAQASRSMPRNASNSLGVGRHGEASVPIAELWNQAYEQLRKGEPKLIEKYENEISLHVSSMVGATVAISGLGKVRRREQMEVLVKQKLKEDEDGKWRIPLGKDRIAIRDLAGHVVGIVDWGKEFVGTALESSPYGSIAWAGVCLLLPLVLNPSKQRASMICGLELISDLLSRCAMYESAYHQRYEANGQGLSHNELDLVSEGYKSALKELYIRILIFQARSVCQLSRNVVSGGFRSVFKIDDWDSLLEDIRLQEASFQTFFDSVKDQDALDAREADHRQRTSVLLDKLEELSLGVKGIRNTLEEIHISEEESKCFEMLRTSNYVARKDLNPKRLPGTCEWFLDHQKYRGWLAHTSTSRLLWVSANPGCGKSVLAKALVDRHDHDGVCYYFFKDDDTVTRSAAHAICALLHQICVLRPDLIKYVLPMYKINGAKLVDSFEDLWSIFAEIIDKDLGNIICILDAIDECSEHDQKKLLQSLATVATTSTSIKILITSRPYKSIEAALFHGTGLDKNEIRLSGEAKPEQSMIEREITIFITFKIQEFQKLRESNDIFDNVHKTLQHHLDGVQNRTYLWVSAVFNELEKDVDAPDSFLMDIIQTLPDSVDGAYENILKKSTKAKKPILIKLLHIMLAAFCPLSLMEMNMALSIQDTSSGLRRNGLHPENSFGIWLRDLCGFFVNIVDNNLYFAHQTAREFLIQDDGYQSAASTGWKRSFQLASSHTLLAQTCINYLWFLYDGSLDVTFQSYATCYWPQHCQSFEADQSLANQVRSFMFQSGSVAPSFVRWNTTTLDFSENNERWDTEVYPVSDLFEKNKGSIGPAPTPLFLACKFGWLSVILGLKAAPDIDWIKQNMYGDTGLHIAAQGNQPDIVKLLLTVVTDVNIQNAWENTALHLAVSRGHIEIVKLILMAGADVIIPDGYGETALHVAVIYGHIEIMRFLLDAGADVNVQDARENTALNFAVLRGHIEIVKLLLKAGADFNIRAGLFGETALNFAVLQGNTEIVRYLLTAGVDVNIQAYEGKTALHSAVSEGHLEIVKILLAAGADVNIQNVWGQTALHSAVLEGHLEIAKLLLTAGAEVNIQNSWETTALHFAVLRGHLETVKLLLAAGADVNIQDAREDTALHLAVSWKHLEIAKILVTAGADVNIRNDNGNTAFHYAVLRGNIEIVRYLLEAGADVNIPDPSDLTALHMAVSHGNIEIVKLLLDPGAAVNIRKSFGETVLHFAVLQGNIEIVRFLLEAGADVNIQDESKNTGLHLPVSLNHLEIAKILVTAGADVNIRNNKGKTALHFAVLRGNIEIVRYLLEAGADINIGNNEGETALRFAVSQGHLEIVKLLLMAGADVNIQDERKNTGLHLAVSWKHLEIAKILVTAVADVNVRNDKGKTALHFAVLRGNIEIVRYLLEAGADVNIRDESENTGLHLAVSWKHLEIAKLLLKAGADVNIQRGLFDQTELHFAVLQGNIEIVRYLLEAGADVNIPDTFGKTALHLAKTPEIKEALLTAGAVYSLPHRDSSYSSDLQIEIESDPDSNSSTTQTETQTRTLASMIRNALEPALQFLGARSGLRKEPVIPPAPGLETIYAKGTHIAEKDFETATKAACM